MTDINTQRIGTFALELCSTKNYQEAFKTLEKFITELGFDSTLYTHIPSIILNEDIVRQPIITTSQEFSEKYMAIYMEAGFHKNDPVVQSINNGHTLHFDWWKEAERKELSKESKEVINVARHDFKMTNGITIPTLTGAQGIAVVSCISSSERQQFDTLLEENRHLISVSSQLFHNHVMNQSYFFHQFLEPSLPKLNTTQKAVFKGLLLGLKTHQIADQIFRSQRHVENVIRDLRGTIGGVDEKGTPLMTKDSLIHYGGLMRFLDQL